MRTHEYQYQETYIAVCEACCLSSLGTSASSTAPPACVCVCGLQLLVYAALSS